MFFFVVFSSSKRFESFLHKDVNFVVTGSHESLEEEKSVFTKSEEKGAKEGSQTLMAKPDGGLSKDKRRQATPRLVVKYFSNHQTQTVEL